MHMKIDPIVKEELWRSVAVFGLSLIITAFVITAGYLPLPAFLLLPLPLAITVAHFLVVVWYRRKEQLVDPNPMSILHHALRSGEQRGENTEQRRVVIEKVIDTVLLVTVFLIYLYVSLAYSIDQIFWLPVLVIIGLLLTRIVFIDGGERRITFARSVVFYLIAAGIVLLRHLVLGNPVVPLFQAIALVGIVSFAALHIQERRRIPKGTD